MSMIRWGKERHTKTIAHELSQSGAVGFSLTEFDNAIKAAQGIGVSDYTRKQYLPRVLDELDFTWHPNNPELYVDSESLELTNPRDPTKTVDAYGQGRISGWQSRSLRTVLMVAIV